MQRVKHKHMCALKDGDASSFATAFQQMIPTCMSVLLPDFGGVYPSNQLPPHQTEPICYIFNSDPAHQPGEHWMAYFQRDKTCDFFDSYGLPLEHYPPIYSWLK